nr:hypothetical protein [Tanacetum cinerariifolium]
MKSSTTNVETSINEEVFHEVSKLFQGESSSSSLNEDVQQSSKEVGVPISSTQSISNNMISNVDEATLRNVDWVNVMQEELDQFEPSYNQNYDGNYYPHELPSFPCCDNCGGSHETFHCQPMDQNIDFSGSDQIQTSQYPDVHPSSQEISDEVFQTNHSVQNDESLENSSKEIAVLNSNEEKEGPSQDFDIQPEHSLSMGYEHLSITLETESDEVTESNAENLLPIPSECEVTLEDKRECDVPIFENSPICDNHSDIFSDSKIDDDISVYDDDFEDIKYVEGSLFDPEIVSVEEENVVHQAENDVYQEEEEIDLEDISQIQDVVLCEKLVSITRLISNIESLNENPTPDHVFNSFASDNSLLDNFSPEFKTFCDHSEETRSGNTTYANNYLPEYDSFCFEIEPDQERLINLVKNDISDDLSRDPLLEEADLFLASDKSIPPGIENFVDDPKGDVCFLEELLIDDSILSHELSDSNFEDNPLIPRPPPEPPDAETDAGEEILVVMNDKDEFDEDYHFFMFAKVFSFLSAESEDTFFDPGIFD